MILKNLEKRIWDLEGFQIRFVDRKSGRDIRGDKENVGNYKYERQAKNSLTVKQFIKKRLKNKRGWSAEVVLGEHCRTRSAPQENCEQSNDCQGA